MSASQGANVPLFRRDGDLREGKGRDTDGGDDVPLLDLRQPPRQAPAPGTCAGRLPRNPACAVASRGGGSLGRAGGGGWRNFSHAGLELVFREAEIYIKEGENNDRFGTHPTAQAVERMRSYNRAHNTFLYAFQVFYSTAFLLLAVFEGPYTENWVPIWSANAGVVTEFFLCCGAGLNLWLQFDFVGWATFRRRFALVSQLLLLTVILCELVVVLATQEQYPRVSRLFRPIFLINCHYMADVRRILRQTAKCVAPVLDLLLLLFFVMFVWALLGFYLFGPTGVDVEYFGSLNTAFMSLYVLLTTANFPTVMMAAFNASRLYFLFFFVYLVFMLYFLQNVVLATVYDSYRKEEVKKFRRLWLHQRAALRNCFRLLRDRQKGGVPFEMFAGLMRHRHPRMAPLHVRLVFMSMNQSESGVLNLSEFYQFYAAERYVFVRKELEFEEMNRTELPLWRWVVAEIGFLATHRRFDYLMSAIVFVNSVLIVAEAAYYDRHDSFRNTFKVTESENIFFLTLYWIEVVAKCIGYGPSAYFLRVAVRHWNWFDFAITAVSTAGVFLGTDVNFFLALRQLRLLRIFRVSTHFRCTLDTIFALLPRLGSFFLALFGVIYYVFAIIGMEAFGGVVHPPSADGVGCCSDTSNYGGALCTNTSSPELDNQGYFYYENSFDNLYTSYVVLFELMIVNNNQVIMNGFINGLVNSGYNADAQWRNQLARAFFVLWYVLVVLIMLNVVIAFVLEFFVTRMEYIRNTTKGGDLDRDELEVEVNLPLELHNRYVAPRKRIELGHYVGAGDSGAGQAAADVGQQWITFVGTRQQTVQDCQLLIYSEELVQWRDEDELDRLRANTDASRRYESVTVDPNRPRDRLVLQAMAAIAALGHDAAALTEVQQSLEQRQREAAASGGVGAGLAAPVRLNAL